MGVKGLQYLLFVANFFLFLFGWMLIICGSVIMNKADTVKCGYVQGTSVYMVVIGCITVVVSFIGCLGAAQKNICLLLLYACLLFIIFLMCIICLIIAFSLRDKVGNDILDGMRADMNTTKDLSYIDDLQAHQKCCGIDGWRDWRNNPSFAKADNLPLSCCDGKNSYCSPKLPVLRKRGCREPYKNVVRYYLNVLGAVATASAAFVLIVAVLTLAMVHFIRAEYNAV